MVGELPVFDPGVVDGAFAAAHSAGDLCALKGGAGRGGGGGHKVLVAKNHLAVGPDIHHQRQLVQLVHVRGQDASDRVGANKASDQRQPVKLRLGMDLESHVRSLDRDGILRDGHIRRQYQGVGRVFQEQVVHAGVAHYHQPDDVLRSAADFFGQLGQQSVDRDAHAAREHLDTLFHGGVGALHHVAAVLALGIQRALYAQLLAGEGVVQVQHDGRGAEVDSRQHRMIRLGQHAGGQIHGTEQALLKELRLLFVLIGHGVHHHVAVDLGLAGEDDLPGDFHLAFFALARAAAGGVGLKPGIDGGLKQCDAFGHDDSLPLALKDDPVFAHGLFLLCYIHRFLRSLVFRCFIISQSEDNSKQK